MRSTSLFVTFLVLTSLCVVGAAERGLAAPLTDQQEVISDDERLRLVMAAYERRLTTEKQKLANLTAAYEQLVKERALHVANLDAYEQQLIALRAQLEAQQRRVQELEQEQALAHWKIAELEKALAERDATKRELKAAAQSSKPLSSAEICAKHGFVFVSGQGCMMPGAEVIPRQQLPSQPTIHNATPSCKDLATTVKSLRRQHEAYLKAAGDGYYELWFTSPFRYRWEKAIEIYTEHCK